MKRSLFLFIFILVINIMLILVNFQLKEQSDNFEFIKPLGIPKREKKEQKVEIKDEIISNIEIPTNILEKKEIEELLMEFFENYYNSLKKLELIDSTYMFQNKENAYIYKTALDLMIENRKKSEFDLKLININYELLVKNYNKSAETISFSAYETVSYKFNYIKEYTSKVYNVRNDFELIKIGDTYKINSYNKVQDFYVMITDLYKKTDDYKSEIDKIRENYVKVFTKENQKIAEMKEKYLSNNYNLITCDHEFDRKKAYDYAINWVGKRNDSVWHTYSANCVNYVSQVMYAGGIPMDYTGSYQWKWYSTKKNTKNTAAGFVYSWTYVPSITSYFKNNKGFGLCGKYNENIYLGDIGDVVVLGSKNPSRHVVTVIGQIKDENGKVIDLLLNSNTVDLEFFPLSAYAYPYKVLMKVYGYND